MLLREPRPTIQFVASVVRMMVASFPGVAFGPLFYRQLDNEKSAALKLHKGVFMQTMVITPVAKTDLQWWSDHIVDTSCPIRRNNPSVVIQMDASRSEWGSVQGCATTGGHCGKRTRSAYISTQQETVTLGKSPLWILWQGPSQECPWFDSQSLTCQK